MCIRDRSRGLHRTCGASPLRSTRPRARGTRPRGLTGTNDGPFVAGDDEPEVVAEVDRGCGSQAPQGDVDVVELSEEVHVLGRTGVVHAREDGGATFEDHGASGAWNTRARKRSFTNCRRSAPLLAPLATASVLALSVAAAQSATPSRYPSAVLLIGQSDCPAPAGLLPCCVAAQMSHSDPRSSRSRACPARTAATR